MTNTPPEVLEKTKPLKLWFAGSNRPYEYDHVDAVFAHSYREAKKLVWQHGDNIKDECDGDYIDLSLSRQKQFDHLATGNDPYVVRDSKSLRIMGWGIEGDARCDSCGLAEYDGEYPVCGDCCQCNECGCCCDEDDSYRVEVNGEDN